MDKDESIRKELDQAKKLVYNSMNIGRDTIESLDTQDETLRGIQDTLEANEHVLNKSMKTMRGMTWSGYLYNQCVSTKELVFNALPPAAPQQTQPSTATSASVGTKSDLLSSSSATGAGSGTSTKVDEDLNEISSAVATLHKMSVDIGNQLDKQSATIDDITDKTDKITDQTLAVTIRASQLSDRSRRSRPTQVGVVQFLDILSGKYLGVLDDRLVLKDRMDRSTYFACFVKEKTLFGLRNEKTLKFVGCAMLGHIVVDSAYFGTQEECYMDVNATPETSLTTGILFLARHWGAGAWLKRPLTDLAKSSEGTSAPPPHPYLTDTTTGISDKTDRIEFRVIRLNPTEKMKD